MQRSMLLGWLVGPSVRHTLEREKEQETPHLGRPQFEDTPFRGDPLFGENPNLRRPPVWEHKIFWGNHNIEHIHIFGASMFWAYKISGA